MRSASSSTSSTSVATTRLYGAVTPRPSQSGPRAARDGRLDLVRLELHQHVPCVDAGRVERRIVHDLRVAPLERLADQRDLARHAGALVCMW